MKRTCSFFSHHATNQHAQLPIPKSRFHRAKAETKKVFLSLSKAYLCSLGKA
uniref:Uncharacterized protein n=1 Tax=Arundo donax TaxID=35708 RepID=A0A0A9GNN8_ARUDO